MFIRKNTLKLIDKSLIDLLDRLALDEGESLSDVDIEYIYDEIDSIETFIHIDLLNA